MEQWLIEHPEALGGKAPTVSDSDLPPETEGETQETPETQDTQTQTP